MLDVVLLLIGALILTKSSGWMIENSLILGKALRLSPTTVGLTIIAFGTSAPELSINVLGSIQGLQGMVLGNVIGSDIANILLVLGIAALLRTIPINHLVIKLGIPLNLLAITIIVVFTQERIGWISNFQGLSRPEGLMLLLAFPLYAYYAFSLGKDHRPLFQIPVNRRKTLLATAGIIASLVGLAFGAEWIIQGASGIAHSFGISDYTIGLTVVALGTSLPELAVTISGVFKRQTGLIVGNIIGSNLFNLLFILGLSVVIRPIPVDFSQTTDLIILASVTALLWIFLTLSKRKQLVRWHGFALIGLYAAIIATRIFGST